MHLVEASAIPLMGRPESWDFHGGKPLGACPDKVLRAARRFFQSCLREGTKSPRMSEQLAAIGVILKDREAKNPQQSLAI